jgi:phosphoribosylglycinamide formyltransferase-1
MSSLNSNIALFASGSGSNFQAIVDAIENEKLPIKIALLVCDNPSAFVIERAHNHHIETLVFNPKSFQNKEEYEQMITNELVLRNISWIFLAGYMRIIGKTLLQSFPNKIVNIHPALLPAFPGAHGIKDAFDYGVKVFGVTVHFVDEGVDTGKIIDQESFKVIGNESIDDVESKIHQVEHQLYPKVIKSLLLS